MLATPPELPKTAQIDTPPPLPEDPVLTLLAESDRHFKAGQNELSQGHVSGAREEFDRAINVLIESPYGGRSEPRIREQFDRLVDRISTYEVRALAEGDGFTEKQYEPASLDDLVPDLEDPPFYVVNANTSDPQGAPPGHSALYVLVPTPNTGLPQDWKKMEAELNRKVPGWLAKVGLTDVEKHLKATHSFTAETWRDDFNVFRGAVFNLSHTWGQLGPMRPKVRSPDIENLFWVGGGTHPGSGLLTIIESANIAASYLAERLGKPFLLSNESTEGLTLYAVTLQMTIERINVWRVRYDNIENAARNCIKPVRLQTFDRQSQTFGVAFR